MATRFAYSLPTDNLLTTATGLALSTGTASAEYVLENIRNGRPDMPFQTTAISAFEIVANLNSAVTLGFAAIFGANLTAGLNVRIQRHATNSWGAPSINVPLVIPAKGADLKPVDPWVDLSAQGAFQWIRLVVPVDVQVPSVGEWWVSSQLRELPTRSNYKWGYRKIKRHDRVEFRTVHSVVRAWSFGVTTRSYRFEVGATDASQAQINTMWEACYGGVKPFVIIPYPAENDAVMVRFTNDPLEKTHVVSNYHYFHLDFDEVSAGVV